MNGYAKLTKLKLQYEKVLWSDKPNVNRLRKMREQIIKLEVDLGIK